MLDFRKVLLVAAVASFGLVSSASAQVWQGGTLAITAPGLPGYAFIESTTQLVPAFNIPIAAPGGGAAPPAGTPVTLLINANVSITNVATSSTNANLDVAIFTSTVANACTGAAVDAATSITLGSSPTQIQVTFSSITAAAPALICVQNLRVNASQVGSTSAISVTTGGIAGGNFAPNASSTLNSVTLAYASKSLGAVTTQPSGATTPGAWVDAVANTNTSICNIVPASTSNAKLSGFTVSTLVINDAPNSLQNAAGLTGAAVPVLAGINAPVAATQGVRLALTLNNLLAGVNYYVGAPVVGGNATAVSYYAGPVGGAALAAAGGSATFPGNVATAFLLTPSGGSATIYIGVTTSGAANTAGTLTIPVLANIPSNAAVLTFTTSSITASVTLVGAASGYPQYSSSQTAYASTLATGATAGTGLITSCSTTILFPYVVNSAGFDTGIVITNASTGTGVTPGSGLCAVTFYGSGAPTAPYSSGTALATTQNLVFAASAQAPGINGYAVASCNFTGAHGYAFIFSGAGTPAAYAADYLGIVLTSAGTTYAPTF